jgi:hypothetical protein
MSRSGVLMHGNAGSRAGRILQLTRCRTTTLGRQRHPKLYGLICVSAKRRCWLICTNPPHFHIPFHLLIFACFRHSCCTYIFFTRTCNYACPNKAQGCIRHIAAHRASSVSFSYQQMISSTPVSAGSKQAYTTIPRDDTTWIR